MLGLVAWSGVAGLRLAGFAGIAFMFDGTGLAGTVLTAGVILIAGAGLAGGVWLSAGAQSENKTNREQ